MNVTVPILTGLQFKRQPARGRRFFRPELDILRFVAFFLVFINHAFPIAPRFYEDLHFPPVLASWWTSFASAGGLGVDLFFALSAYLITELLIREHERFGRIGLRDFYIRRGLRIYPLYYGFLALVIFTNKVFEFGGYLSPRYKLLFLLPLGNWACAMWGAPPTVSAHLWSVSIEEQFYFTYPLLLRFFGIQRIVHIAVGMLVIANLTRVILLVEAPESAAVWFNTFARLDPIAFGAVMAVVLRRRTIDLGRVTRIIIGAGGLVALVVAARFTRGFGPGSLVFYPLVAAGATMLLFAFLRMEIGKSYLTRTLIYLGRISYGLYVWHLLALDRTRFRVSEKDSINFVVNVTLGLLLSVAVSVVSYELYESYFLKLKERFTRVPSRPV